MQAVSDTLSDRLFSTDAGEIERTLANKAYVRSGVLGYVFSNDTGPHVPNAVPFFRDRKSTRLNSSHSGESRMPSSA